MNNDIKPKANKKPTEEQTKTVAALRKDLHGLIDVLPGDALQAIKPLLKYLAEDQRKV